ncbi:copper chaperone CopZ [Halalkalibacterium halodurans]|uniref:Copper chaperone CopZ n=2 Tax=Halalkalibacterium halodurans TaxID=86665 RepID=Q9KFC8_HALH5|nr:copper chaperone CopZ [Halalkalibacterium halodurans]MDY7221052.1 copper chaperone CopZ [Halalkalibacterium halodurans]MDY7240291.1 copper chaperone CopZ [Halalkalibacterium halodurans]MED3645444.1 copper chaperone CopZ [Halalkalibacterium halodurans]MED4079941.1 copper chaperone CopZ [Halalkalibacterium halodurans]MED4086706.1 copper chaperone CopZ [Halalkalibacterium halodurans]
METTLNVKGMSCQHCVKAVEENVGQLTGVEKVTVQLDKGTVNVSYKEDQVSIDKIKDTIEDQGYDVE